MDDVSFAFFGDFQKAIEYGDEELFDESLKLFCTELQSFNSLPEAVFSDLLQTFALPKFPYRDYSYKLPKALVKFLLLIGEEQKKRLLKFIENQGGEVRVGTLFHFYLVIAQEVDDKPWPVADSILKKRECYIREEIQNSVFSSGNTDDFEWSMWEFEQVIMWNTPSTLTEEQFEFFIGIAQSAEFLELEDRSAFFQIFNLELNEEVLNEKQQLIFAKVFETLYLKIEMNTDLISCGEFICDVYKDERALEVFERLKSQGGKLARIFVADTLVYFTRTYADAGMRTKAEAILMAMKNDPNDDVKDEAAYALARLEGEEK